MTQVKLPAPRQSSDVSVEEAIARRRSRRQFAAEPLTLEQAAQLLWAAQGVTDAPAGKRAAPSAGATYPMEVFLAVGTGSVEGLEAGVYRYLPGDHSVELAAPGDVRGPAAAAALGQGFVAAAPLSLLMAADFSRTERRYRERAVRYVHMEAGHIGQNVYLQAEALGLATVTVGAFRDEELASVFHLPRHVQPLCLMPVGHPG